MKKQNGEKGKLMFHGKFQQNVGGDAISAPACFAVIARIISIAIIIIIIS